MLCSKFVEIYQVVLEKEDENVKSTTTKATTWRRRTTDKLWSEHRLRWARKTSQQPMKPVMQEQKEAPKNLYFPRRQQAVTI